MRCNIILSLSPRIADRLRKSLVTRCRLKVNVKVQKSHDCLRPARNNHRRLWSARYIACKIANVTRSRVRCVRPFLPLFTRRAALNATYFSFVSLSLSFFLAFSPFLSPSTFPFRSLQKMLGFSPSPVQCTYYAESKIATSIICPLML